MKYLIVTLLISSQAFSWGRRGHSLVGETAAYVLNDPFFRELSVEMSFYNIVPDAIWKSLKEKDIERTEHFIDLEIYERANATDWNSDRKAFLKKHPVPVSAGRAFWRVGELEQELKKLVKKHNEAKTVEDRKRVQGDWQKLAGILGHYIADLSQPLHVTENHDGQLTGQPGLHSFYETEVVNELYPEIGPEVHKKAAQFWKERGAELKKKDAFQLAVQLSYETKKDIEPVLEIDKKQGRDMNKVKWAYREKVVEELARGGVYLAAIWAQNLPDKMETQKVYEFRNNPAYIFPNEKKQVKK